MSAFQGCPLRGVSLYINALHCDNVGLGSGIGLLCSGYPLPDVGTEDV